METETTQTPLAETNLTTLAAKIEKAFNAVTEEKTILENQVNEQAKEEAEKYNHKLTEAEFLEELEENNGLFAQTAQAIRRNYGITYSRQAVRERAKNYYATLKDQEEKVIDLAKGTIIDAIEQNNDKKLKYRAASFLISKLKYGKYHSVLKGPFND